MQEDKIIVYPLTVKGQKRKALDLESIYNFIQNRILSANPMFQDTSEVGLATMSINEYKGMNALGIVGELVTYCEQELGIAEKPKVSEVIEKPKPKVKEPEKEIEENSEPEVVEAEESTDDEDDVVTLDE